MTVQSAFLRSINLVFDADNPTRVAHFQPTAKSVTLMRSLAGLTADRAFFVTAPYGSGKSLTATYLLHLIQNRPEARDALKAIQRRLSSMSPEMAAFAHSARRVLQVAAANTALPVPADMLAQEGRQARQSKNR